MSEYIDYFTDDIPAIYELGVLRNGEALRISTHTALAKRDKTAGRELLER